VPTKAEFLAEIRSQMREAELRGDQYLLLNAGEIHRKLGGYPSVNHQIKPCCDALYDEAKLGRAKVVAAPKRGYGASLTIRYVLPRAE
jgi:hypothetical protein